MVRVSVVPTPQVAGRYRLLGLLGRGGMGSVWLAHDPLLEREVALKELAPGGPADALLLQEARAAARVTHPAVVRVHDIVVHDGAEWMVMERLPGESLRETLRVRSRLSVGEVAAIGLRVLSALEAIHGAGLVHRDVKPGNIQMCGGDRVVLADFGMASAAGTCGGLRNGTVYGSPAYLAPETIRVGEFSAASDLYALGVTLYQAVEGVRPFGAGDAFDAIEGALHRAPDPTRHAGPLAPVLDVLLAKDPTERPNLARTRDLLADVLNGCS